MRRAGSDDITLLVNLMAEFYAESGYELDRAYAAGAFATLLGDERLGYVWVIQANGNDGLQDVGHVVITLRFGMEYGGLVACLDDLYVAPSWRSQGLSTAALVEVRHFCEGMGVRAMTVEVGFRNAPAQKVYRRLGFEEAPDRQLLALGLASPSHVVTT